MGKQKYPITAGGTTIPGESRQRNHTKSGKLAKRRETRRLEAIARQVENIRGLEKALEKAKDKAELQKDLTNAQLTLQKIRGGVPHKALLERFTAPPQNETTPSKEDSAPPSKKNRKASRTRKGGTSPAPAGV